MSDSKIITTDTADSTDGTGTQTAEVSAALAILRGVANGSISYSGSEVERKAASVLSAEIERLTRRVEELQTNKPALTGLQEAMIEMGFYQPELLASAAAPDERKERIVRAAIRWGEAVYSVPRPGRHGDVYRVIEAERSLEDDSGPDAQGFLTSTGRFVGRIEARDLARRAGQLLPETKPHHELFSEDVWRTPDQDTAP